MHYLHHCNEFTLLITTDRTDSLPLAFTSNYSYWDNHEPTFNLTKHTDLLGTYFFIPYDKVSSQGLSSYHSVIEVLLREKEFPPGLVYFYHIK